MSATPAVAQMVVTPMEDGRVAVQVQAFGATKDAAVDAARLQAVEAVVARVSADDHLILADDLLAKYLGNYSGKFVKAVEVLEDQPLRDGFLLDSRVYVDYNALVADLEEKRFLYTPAFRPFFTVYLSETIEGEESSGGLVRDALTFAVDDLGLRPFEGARTTPSPSMDVMGSLDAAQQFAQRNGIELIVTGESTTTLTGREKLYFNEYTFYDTMVEASLVRVDTGELIATVRASGSAGDPNRSTALNKSARAASEAAAEELIAAYEDYWPMTVQGEADFRLLLSGADEETTSIVASKIRALSPSSRAEVRRRFGQSAVLAVAFSGDKTELFRALGEIEYPRLEVLNPRDEEVFELQVVAN